MVTRFNCPSCSGAIEADGSSVGLAAACPHCEATVQVPDTRVSPGTQLGDFRLDKRLGRGGMGEVFQATQLSMDRTVAVKVLPTEMTGSRDAVERFIKEAKLSARLEHPNIVTVHTAGEDEGCYYYVMSFVDGQPLDARLEKDGALPEKEVLSIAIAIAEGLDFAWTRHGMLHRDVKPANVVVDADGIAKLLDFGLAKTVLEDQALTMTGTIMGTPHYMSPEQARGSAELDFRADQYALGATTYHLLAGVRPFEADSVMGVLARLATEEPAPLREHQPGVSENCARVIQVMMAKDPTDRYPDYPSLIKDLKRVRANKRPLGPHGKGIGLPNLPQPGAAAATLPPRMPVQKPKAKRWPWLLAGGFAALLLLAVAGGNRKPKSPTIPVATATPEPAATPSPTPASPTQPPPAQPAAAPAQEPAESAASPDRPDWHRRPDRPGREDREESRPRRERWESLRERIADQRTAAPPPAPGSDEDDWDAHADAPATLVGIDPPPASAAPPAKLAPIAAEVCGLLLDLDWPAAKDKLSPHAEAAQNHADFAAYWRQATLAAVLPEIIRDSFKPQIGNTVPVQLQSGESIQFIPESIARDGVVGRQLIRDGNVTGRIKMTLNVAELNIVERLKRLPPETESDGAILRGLAAIEAGRPDAANRLFGQADSKLGAALLADLQARLHAKAAAAQAARERAAEAAKSANAVRAGYLQAAEPVSRPAIPSTSRLARGSAEALESQQRLSRERGLPIEIEDKLGIRYRLIPAGSFRRADGATVTITRPFYMGTYEVTQRQWEAVVGHNPASESGANLPVDQVAWTQADRFAAAACGKLGLPEGMVRLPTEAEWEYAARAGTSGDVYFDGKLDDFANLFDVKGPDTYRGHNIAFLKDRDYNDGESTLAKVGSYRPNAFGLHDVYGNVYEWCSDWSGPYNHKDLSDPTGPVFGLFRIHRGGSYLYKADFCNSSKRHQSPARDYVGGQIAFGNGLGLRLLREIR